MFATLSEKSLEKNGAAYELCFSPANERFFYKHTPYDVEKPFLGQYKILDVKGHYVYSNKYELVQVCM